MKTDSIDGAGLVVVAVMEDKASDRGVAKRAARLANPGGGRLVLLEVLHLVDKSMPRIGGGPRIQPWELMRSMKAASRGRLVELAEALDVAEPVTVEVRFGDRTEMIEMVAIDHHADVVIAAGVRHRWFSWLPVGLGRASRDSTPIMLLDQAGVADATAA